MNPLRGSAWSRCKNSRLFAFLTFPDEPFAGIVRVEALSLWRRANSSKSRRTLCGDRACRSGAVRFCCSRNGLLEVVSWFARLLSQSRGRGFDSPLVRGSSVFKNAAYKYNRSMRSVLLQLRLENRNFLSTNVVRGAHSRSSGWKIATFKYKNSTRSTFPQLRQHLT